MDSSLPKKRKIRKRIVLYLNRVPNIHCVRSAEDLKNMPGSLIRFFPRSNDESISFLFNGTLAGRRQEEGTRAAPKLF